MAFSTEDTEIEYVGDGSTSTFVIPFNYQNPLYIFAQKIDLTDPDAPVIIELDQDIDFLVTPGFIQLVVPDVDGFGDPIFVPVPLELNEELRVYRVTADIRANDYNTYQFPYPSVNNEMDRIYQRLQELKTALAGKIGLSQVSIEAGITMTAEEIYETIQQIEALLAAGGGLPPGGADGNFLEKDTSDPIGAVWKEGAYDGISALTGAQFTSTGLKDTLDKIIRITYTPAAISLSASPGQGLREKGTNVASVDLAATTVKKSNPIGSVRFYRAGVLVNTVGAPNPAGGVNNYTNGTAFSDNMSFYAQVDDTLVDGNGPNTTQSNTVTYSFVYPYYYGAGVPGKTAAQVAALTKSVISSTASLNVNFTAIIGDVFYFAYPASYGALTSILDPNNFEVLGDWTLTTSNITGLDGNAVSYRIYKFNNPVGVAGSTAYTFKR